MNANALTVIDTSRREVLNTVLLDGFLQGAANPWGVACTADGRWICVSHAGTHELSVIDAPALLETLRICPGGFFERGLLRPEALTALRFAITRGRYCQRQACLAGMRERVKLRRGAQGAGCVRSHLRGEYLPTASRQSPWGLAKRLGAQHPWTGGRQWNQSALRSAVSRRPPLSARLAKAVPVSIRRPRADALNWDLLNDGEQPKNTKGCSVAPDPTAMASGVRATAESCRSGIKNILMSERPNPRRRRSTRGFGRWRRAKSFLVDGRLSASPEGANGCSKSERVGCPVAIRPRCILTWGIRRGSRNESDERAAFDTPTLVEVWRSSPYLHDGRYTRRSRVGSPRKHGRADRLTSKNWPTWWNSFCRCERFASICSPFCLAVSWYVESGGAPTYPCTGEALQIWRIQKETFHLSP